MLVKLSLVALGLGMLLMGFGVEQSRRYDALQAELNRSEEWRTLTYLYEQHAVAIRANAWELGKDLEAKERDAELALEKRFPDHAEMSTGFSKKIFGFLLSAVGLIGCLTGIGMVRASGNET